MKKTKLFIAYVYLSIINISIIAQGSLITTDIAKFGDGYNSISNSVMSKRAIEFDSIKHNNSENSRTFHLNTQIYSTNTEIRDLSKYLRNMSASFRAGKFEAFASSSHSKYKELSINSYSTYMRLDFNINYGTDILVNPRLTKEALKLLRNNKTDFINMYGNEYVNYINYGAKVEIIFEFSESGTSSKESTKSDFELYAKYWKASGSLRIVKEDSSKLKEIESKVKAYIYVYGLDSKNELPDLNISDLSKFVKSFISKNNSVKTIVSVGTKPINDLIESNGDKLDITQIYNNKLIVNLINDIIESNNINKSNALFYLNNKSRIEFESSILIQQLEKFGIFIDTNGDTVKTTNKQIDTLQSVEKYITEIDTHNFKLYFILYHLYHDFNFKNTEIIDKYRIDKFQPPIKPIGKSCNYVGEKLPVIRMRQNFSGYQTFDFYNNGKWDNLLNRFIYNNNDCPIKIKIVKSAKNQRTDETFNESKLEQIKLAVLLLKDSTMDFIPEKSEIILEKNEGIIIGLNLIDFFGAPKGHASYNNRNNSKLEQLFPYSESVYNFEIEIFIETSGMNK